MADAYKVKVFVEYIPLDAEFEFEKGEKIVIIGENGSGKTSLAEAIAGIHSWVKFEPEKLKCSNFALLPQFPEYNPNLSVYETFELFSSKMPASLKDLGIFPEKKLKFLSGGQTKLVLLFTILNSPKEFVILDEPFVNLDYSKRLFAMQSILSSKKTIFIISHFPETAQLADRLIL